MAKINTILFDFDGTVMNTTDVIIQSWQHTFKTVEGKERPIEGIIRSLGEPLVYTMKMALPQISPEEGVEIYRSYHRHNFGELISVFPGVTELLVELKNQGYKMAIVTSRLRGTTEEGLEKYDLRKYFDCVITADECSKHKPDPEPILMALEKLNALPEQAIMVGDTMFDIGCAKNAGVQSVLVGWAIAVTEEDKIGPNKPDHVIEEALDLMGVIG